ncbi:DUF2795 domain-containing protein [Streptomyces sp. NBC_00670]|jgi:hypothetical protein|uniref:DUF2795 domain-containing protein n=1 Tax=Streptomyces sp. NBC_00670 TaxID=2975804 RepID=UPI002E305D3B|nr:DUF2795 domain-containing protein [Streptomyces sp. NBC_00670]
MAKLSPVDLQQALKGADYPATGEDLARLARDNGAASALVDALAAHGKDEFDGPNKVSRTVFGSD